jgi:hypothetical protein
MKGVTSSDHICTYHVELFDLSIPTLNSSMQRQCRPLRVFHVSRFIGQCRRVHSLPPLQSVVSTASPEFIERAASMEALVGNLRSELSTIREGG